MRLTVVQQGRIRDPHCQALREEYCKRFRRYGQLQWVDHESRKSSAQSMWPDHARWRVLLDERGKAYSSPELARQLEHWTMRYGPIAFAIGGADGHNQATQAAADCLWSLSALTLPHQLANVICCEQLYRAASITRGDPYHHAG